MDGRRCVAAALARTPLPGPVHIAAVGKAAAAMALGAREALGSAPEHTLVITRDADSCTALSAFPDTEIHIGAHPLPDERTLACGARLLAWVRALPPAATPLFLISGGASALVEVLAPGVSLAALQDLNREGLRSGVDIAAFNARRVQVSALKGGKLAAALGGRPARALFISDVPGDDPAVIGSGLMGPAAGGDRVQREVIASIETALEGAAAHAAAQGLAVHRAPQRFADSAVRVAARCAHELSLQRVPVCLWGGESTVTLPPNPGRGGRNLQLALAAARLIAGHDELLLLAAGTDGSDGVSEAAGALIDADTCARVSLAGLDADDCLARADAERALQASGDLIYTGPTGTNVGDLVIGLKLPRGAAVRGGELPRVL